MYINRKNEGITLIALIVTIIVMLIIAGVSVYSGTDEIKSAKENMYFSELTIIQHAVEEAYYQYKLTKNENYFNKFEDSVATDIASVAANLGITLQVTNLVNANPDVLYYRLTPEKLKEIGIKSSENTFIVNFSTGEVINETIGEINSKVLYLKGTTTNAMTFDGSDH